MKGTHTQWTKTHKLAARRYGEVRQFATAGSGAGVGRCRLDVKNISANFSKC